MFYRLLGFLCQALGYQGQHFALDSFLQGVEVLQDKEDALGGEGLLLVDLVQDEVEMADE